MTKDMKKTRVIYGEANNDVLEMLSRSIIGESLVPLNLNPKTDKLKQELTSVACIKDMGVCKALITFPSKKELAESLMNAE